MMAGNAPSHANPRGDDSWQAPARKKSSSKTARGAGSSSASGARNGKAAQQPIAVPIKEGTVLMSPVALSNNEKLFPAFRTQLSDGRPDGTFKASAEKVAMWASKDKAS